MPASAKPIVLAFKLELFVSESLAVLIEIFPPWKLLFSGTKIEPSIF
ncbi:MAG: hypothetical protein HC907_37195 [Richelia sp. SM1_7_0]|nr:hypothetical protein [Richelia sp. SM1_7_0]